MNKTQSVEWTLSTPLRDRRYVIVVAQNIFLKINAIEKKNAFNIKATKYYIFFAKRQHNYTCYFCNVTS